MKYCDTCHSSYPGEFTTCPRDQNALRKVNSLIPGMILRGKYEILGEIGAGGMGAVYKARHKVFGELRAIKLLGEHLAADGGYLDRFRGEAMVARKLQHQNAVRVEDFDTTEDGRPFIVMEFAQGKSLRAVLQDEFELPLRRVVEIGRQALAALGAAHALGIVHRDIKPDNIVVIAQPDGSDLVKVLDFGLAKIREGFEGSGGQVATRTGMLVGTPEYMSPEQATGTRGDDLDGRSDIYALGIVLYEMVAGRVPFRADTPIATILQHVQDDPAPLGELRPDAPRALADALMKSLAKDRAERFQTADEMSAALVASLSSGARGSGTHRAAAVKPEGEAPRQGSGAAIPATGAARRPSGVGPARPGGPRPPATLSGRGATVRLPAPAAEPEATDSSNLYLTLGAVAIVIVGLAMLLGRRSAAPPATPAVTVQATAGDVSAPAASGPQDAEVQAEVERLLYESVALRSARIAVQAANGIVTLTGEAADGTSINLATQLARTAPGVRSVFSTVQVSSAAPAQMADRSATATQATEPDAPPATLEPPPAPTAPPAAAADAAQRQVRELLDRARQAMESRDHRAAQPILEEVLRLDPGNPVAVGAMEHIRSGRPPGGPAGPPRRP